MMENAVGWIDNSDGELVQFDFSAPAHWSGAQCAAQQMRFAAMLGAAGAHEDAAAPGWLALARRLPAALRSVLEAELRAGNHLGAIGSTGWPHVGSIVVKLRERFATAERPLPDGVVWRRLDDPHYAREEMCQKAGAVEHLLVT